MTQVKLGDKIVFQLQALPGKPFPAGTTAKCMSSDTTVATVQDAAPQVAVPSMSCVATVVGVGSATFKATLRYPDGTSEEGSDQLTVTAAGGKLYLASATILKVGP